MHPLPTAQTIVAVLRALLPSDPPCTPDARLVTDAILALDSWANQTPYSLPLRLRIRPPPSPPSRARSARKRAPSTPFVQRGKRRRLPSRRVREAVETQRKSKVGQQVLPTSTSTDIAPPDDPSLQTFKWACSSNTSSEPPEGWPRLPQLTSDSQSLEKEATASVPGLEGASPSVSHHRTAKRVRKRPRSSSSGVSHGEVAPQRISSLRSQRQVGRRSDEEKCSDGKAKAQASVLEDAKENVRETPAPDRSVKKKTIEAQQQRPSHSSGKSGDKASELSNEEEGWQGLSKHEKVYIQESVGRTASGGRVKLSRNLASSSSKHSMSSEFSRPLSVSSVGSIVGITESENRSIERPHVKGLRTRLRSSMQVHKQLSFDENESSPKVLDDSPTPGACGLSPHRIEENEKNGSHDAHSPRQLRSLLGDRCEVISKDGSGCHNLKSAVSKVTNDVSRRSRLEACSLVNSGAPQPEKATKSSPPYTYGRKRVKDGSVVQNVSGTTNNSKLPSRISPVSIERNVVETPISMRAPAPVTEKNAPPQDACEEMTVALSRFGDEVEADLAQELIARLGGETVASFKEGCPSCVVAPVDQKSGVVVRQQMMILHAIASGIPVVTMFWLVESFRSGRWRGFDEFEALPRSARGNGMMFRGVVATFEDGFSRKNVRKQIREYQEDVERLFRLAGGMVTDRTKAKDVSSMNENTWLHVQIAYDFGNDKLNTSVCFHDESRVATCTANMKWLSDCVVTGQCPPPGR